MTPERWREIERIYHDALARPEGERAAFVAQVCAGEEPPLFDVRPIRPANAQGLPFTVYDVSPDGQRFLVNTVDESAGVAPISLVVNWPQVLKKRQAGE